MIDGLPSWAPLIPLGMLTALVVAILASPHTPSRTRLPPSPGVWRRSTPHLQDDSTGEDHFLPVIRPRMPAQPGDTAADAPDPEPRASAADSNRNRGRRG